MRTLKEKRWTMFHIYLVTFLSTVSYAFVIYINSSFLQKFIDEDYLGLVYGISSVLSLILLVNISPILRRFGHLKTMLGIFILEAFSLGMAAFLDFCKNFYTCGDGLIETFYVPLLVLFSFLTFATMAVLVRLSLDLYLEKFSKNKETGEARGIFLLIINTAIAASPFLVGKILQDGDYYRVYIIAALILIPAIVITLFKLRKVTDVAYHEAPFIQGLKKLWKNKDLHAIFMSNFLLEFFYAWMTIYTPIYLYSIMGFSWENIGTIFSLMLTSFIFLQLPLGKIADKYLGEKEILTAGFIIAGLATMYLSFISGPVFSTWVIALFMTRVGAAAIEIMNETYFFKKVTAKDSDIMGFFRNASPLAYIIAPIIASVLLPFMNFKYLFLVLGIIMLYGVRYSLAIEDTL